MSNNGSTQVPPNSTGNLIDCSSLSVGGVTAYRQRVVLADNTGSASFAVVSAGSLQVTVQNTVPVSGTIDKISAAVSLAAGANNIGAVSLAAGTAQIGYLQKISASVTVQGNIGINAGTNHIGEMNISLMPAVVIAAGTNNIGSINNISATVLVAGSLTIGGTTGNTSATVGSSFTLIGGMDGALGRVALTDASGHFVITGTVALTSLNGIGKIDGISAAVAISSLNGLGKIDGISAAVSIASLNGLGKIDGISAAVVLAAGTNNIGTVNNISAAVTLAAGSANIGSINNISAAVVLAAGTSNIGAVSLAAGTSNIGSINNISANVNVVLQAGANNIGSINNISAAVVLAAGAANIGSINNISAAISLVANTAYHPTAAPSASHGPKTVSMTASATVALIAAPGASTSIYVTGILATNGSSTLTQLQIYEASATATPVIAPFLAASGGGFSTQFDPPWRISANTALNARLKPSVGATVCVTLNFYVGA